MKNTYHIHMWEHLSVNAIYFQTTENKRGKKMSCVCVCVYVAHEMRQRLKVTLWLECAEKSKSCSRSNESQRIAKVMVLVARTIQRLQWVYLVFHLSSIFTCMRMCVSNWKNVLFGDFNTYQPKQCWHRECCIAM